MTSPITRTAAWLIQQLKRDDLPADVRKRYKNRLKMQGASAHPHAGKVARGFYTRDAWKKVSRRRKLAQAAKRRNRRG